MKRRATFWSWLDEGRCRMCLWFGRTVLVADPARHERGAALRARHALINHARAYHPTSVAAIECGGVLHQPRASQALAGDAALALPA